MCEVGAVGKISTRRSRVQSGPAWLRVELYGRPSFAPGGYVLVKGYWGVPLDGVAFSQLD